MVGLVVVAGLGGASAATRSSAATSWQWYKADVHVHSSGVSPDAAQDLGVLSQAAKAQGLNAVFVTDHGAGSNQPIASAIANHIVFDDAFSYWKTAVYGTVTSSTEALAATPRTTGTQSLHVAASSAGYGEAITWYKRGPNLRSGDLVLKFSVYPTRIDPGSGVYVSLAVGGDSTLKDATGSGCDSTSGKGGPPNGYTTQAGVISPGKSNVFIWQLGTPRAASSDPNARVFTHQLQYTLNAWNTYTIDVSQALTEVPLADRPDDYNGLGSLKMVAAANAGTADAYFDNYHLDAMTPVASGDEFIHRNSIIHEYDTSSFKMFPGLEAGSSQHATRFNYDITDPAQYTYYSTGPPSILPTQQSGYPAQLDHPAFPGGVSQQAAIANLAYGADLMEAVPRGGNEAMIATWDGILKQGVPLIGTWSSDAHRTETFGQGTEIYAPSLDFDSLMRSLYEGRAYMANNSFSGRVLFSPDVSSQEPYPARYPIYVSPATASMNLTTAVSGGLSGGSVKWVQDGAVSASDPVTAASYQGTKAVSLATLPTYVRTEVRDSKNALLAMSEPIFFMGVTGLPARMSYHVVGVTTPDGKNYTKIAVQGITASSWDGTAQALSLTLANPAGSLVELSAATAGLTPTAFAVGGSTISPASSLAAFQTATGSTWFYDTSTGILHLKATQGSASGTSARVSFSGSTDTQPPSAPTNLHQTANDQTSVSLAWTASTDDVGVAHYNVYVDGQLASAPTTTSTSVAGLTCGTSHSFGVEAADAVGNVSPSTTITAAAATCPPTTTLTPVADAYVDASAGSVNFGTSAKLRVDTSPDVRSYVKFNLAGLSGVTNATLRIFATSALTSGYDIRGVSDNSWTETGLTYANAPAVGTTVAGTSGPVAASTWTSVDVTSLVAGGGSVSFAVTGRSTTALSFASRESGTTAPQLVVQATGGGTDSQPPTVPTNLHTTGNTTSSVSLAWTASTDNVAVDHYTVYVDGNSTGQTNGTTFIASGLACGTSHSFAVEAVDGAGNVSTRSGVLSAGTAACSGNDTQPPTVPTNLQTTAVTQTSISLAWTASTDNVGVIGYRVYDGTTVVGSPANTTFTLTGLTCGTSHTLSVDALDAASNASQRSAALTLPTAQCGGSNMTFAPAADAYVDGSVPTTAFGNSTKLRVDTSPDVRSYLRFNVTGLSGTVTNVKLLVFATSALAAGYDVRSVSDSTWTEVTIDYANAPAVAAAVTASSGPVTASTWVSVDVTSLVNGNGVVSLALTGKSTTALALASRESTTAPQLVVTTS